MRYTGKVFRPPSEANSLILQITIGCAHNKCTFCGMYKEDKFSIRNIDEVIEDLHWARNVYRKIRKIFLADGDALVLPTEHIMRVLDEIKVLFPECERVGIYANASDILRKSDDDLKLLSENGLKIAYIGAESGSDEILKRIRKNATKEELVEAVRKVEAAGIQASVTFISGMGGKELWKEHAVDTGKMISEMEATYVGLLTLMLEENTELYRDIVEGKFEVLDAQMVLDETELMIENINLKKPCIFRSNHASNYLSLKGTFPQDKQKLLAQIKTAKNNAWMLKDERFRLL